MDLIEIRNQIDDCDRKIVSAFVERMKLAGNIAEYKRKMTYPFLMKTGKDP